MGQASAATVVELRHAECSKLYIKVMQAVSSHWSLCLTAPEIAILLFVAQRTLRWGKYREAITYNHFINGVYSRETGECIQSPLCHSKRTILRALCILELNHFITITRSSNSVRGHMANIFEINCKYLLEKGMPTIKLPKNREPRVVASGTKGSGIGNQGLCHREPTNVQKDNVRKGNVQKTQPTAGAVGSIRSIEDAVTQVRSRAASRRMGLVEKGKKAGRLMRDPTIALWHTTLLNYYPKIPTTSLTIKEFGMFAKAVQLHMPHVALEDFFEWVISRWVTLRGGKMAWMNKNKDLMPLAPSLPTVSRYLRVFAKVYAEDVVSEQLNEEKKAVVPRRRFELEQQADRATIARQQAEIQRLQEKNERLKRVRSVAAPTRSLVDVSVSGELIERAKSIYNEE